MSALSRRAILSLRTSSILPRMMTTSSQLSQSKNQPTSTSSTSREISSKPVTISTPPQFPPPVDPFESVDLSTRKEENKRSPTTTSAVSVGATENESIVRGASQKYSDSTKSLVKGVARLMGYNSRASTAIRETGRMMRGIVEAIERDRSFWYDRCALPPTYQTFFQVHLLYVLILLPRIRALPASSISTSSIPEPLTSSEPQPTEPVTPTSSNFAHTYKSSILSKPDYEAYQNELLSHFFEMAESQMRLVLGRGERERVIRKYMDEMGEQWRGASTGLDYVLGLGMSEDLDEKIKADSELASWVWRNLFASKGLTPAPPATPSSVVGDEGEVEGGVGAVEEVDELDLIRQVELVVRFVRKEMSRLDRLRDDDVLSGNIGEWAKPDEE